MHFLEFELLPSAFILNRCTPQNHKKFASIYTYTHSNIHLCVDQCAINRPKDYVLFLDGKKCLMPHRNVNLYKLYKCIHTSRVYLESSQNEF